MSEVKSSVDNGILNSGRLNRLSNQIEDLTGSQSNEKDASPLITSNQQSKMSLS